MASVSSSANRPCAEGRFSRHHVSIARISPPACGLVTILALMFGSAFGEDLLDWPDLAFPYRFPGRCEVLVQGLSLGFVEVVALVVHHQVEDRTLW